MATGPYTKLDGVDSKKTENFFVRGVVIARLAHFICLCKDTSVMDDDLKTGDQNFTSNLSQRVVYRELRFLFAKARGWDDLICSLILCILFHCCV
jgi:hypothetical protein